MSEWLMLAQAAVGGLFAGGGVWAAIRVEIRLMWREHDKTDKRLGKVEDRINAANLPIM